MIEAAAVAAGPFCGLDLKPPLEKGATCALVGPNGSGKSTFLRLLNGSQAPAQGRLRVDGELVDGSRDARRTLRCRVALVRQDPRDQLVSGRVADEVAFGPRNLGLAPDEVRRRTARALDAAGLAEALACREAAGLSGGELQRLALAGALAMEPSWLAVDEPCAMLDERARAQVRAALRGSVRSGAGLVLATHYVREVAGAERVLVFGHGDPRQLGPEQLFVDAGLMARCGLDRSAAGRAAAFLARNGLPLALLQQPGRCIEALRDAGFGFDAPGPCRPMGSDASGGLALRDVTVRAGDAVLARDISLHVPRGTVTLVSGPSGSGKTTVARAMAGLLSVVRGEALLDGTPVRPGHVGLALQRPESQLFCDTVLADVAFGPAMLGVPEDEAQTRARRVLLQVGLGEELWGLSPFELSGGEARKAALAGVLACGRGAYVLDEPTAGLDGPSRQEVRDLVARLAGEGAAVAVMSHDVEEWLPVASQVVLLRDGSVAWRGAPQDAVAAGLLEDCGMAPSLGLLMLREAWR